jgi:hypothetical protein
MPVLRALLSFSGIVHIVLGLLLMRWVWSDSSHVMTLTARQQFNNWGGLLSLYKTPYVSGPDSAQILYAKTLSESWCDLTSGSVPNAPEFCACVAKQYAHNLVSVNNESYAQHTQSVSDDTVSGLISCIKHRPPWKVYATPWVTLDAVCVGIPVLLISGVLIIFAAGWAHAELYGSVAIVAVIVALLVSNFTRFWLSCLSLSFFILIVHMYIAKGMRATPLALRLGCAVWIGELFVAPMFVILVCMFHSARDIVMLVAVAAIISVSTSFGAHSFWNMHIFKITPHHMMTTQWLAWIGMLCCTVCSSAFILMYWDSTFSRFTGSGFEVLLGLTYLNALLQVPTPMFSNVGLVQMVIITLRNVGLFGVIWAGF